MKIEGKHQIRAPRERVYETLIDPEVLQRIIPGCEQLERTGENTFAATMRTGVGSIKGVFKGNVRLEDLRAPEHFRMVVDGKGAPGFLKGSGDLDLQTDAETTTVSYTGDVQVGGTIASVGQRMIQGTVKMMATQFFTALETEVQAKKDDPPPKHGFFRTALRWLRRVMQRLVKD
jgi:carbon monoxide dehydrogenase subunit G